ncbi:MAG TPA: TIGR03960 family B12-binding radical SAM protein [Planctomycetota bacterium]|nr:TIGR03960 family B12-binding radical SAM protein [Planctomycetota bacterium]
MFSDLLPLVEKPSRYLGNELNAVKKDPGAVSLKVALAYPDFYEVGMSNTGLHILYYLLNERPEIAAERVYLPGRDLEALMKERGEPLVSLENRIPIRDFDIFGIQLPHELAYTNIVKLLRLARLPIYAAARSDRDPIVLGGGPGAFGPEAVAPFYDAILLGDAEEAILAFCDKTRELRARGATRREQLLELAKIEGVYVPSFFDVRYKKDGTIEAIVPLVPGQETVRKALVLDLEKAYYPDKAIVPFADTVHNRLGIEVMRGCTVGCRFCQAGMIYRPLRERSPRRILDLAKCGLQATGFEDVSLLSLDTGDYTLIEPLTKALLDQTQEKRIALSLPSLRAGSLSDETISEIKRVRKTGFTIAPEAGTQRLRDVINKNISDAEIFETVERVSSQGWSSIKLYFMVGFPTETKADLDGLCDLALKVRRIARRYEKDFDVTVSVGALVPKPHTPFQWDAQLSTAEAQRRMRYIVDRLRPYHLAVKYWDPRISWLEGILTRADRRFAPVIAAAEEAGCGFDSWTEYYKPEVWARVFREHGIDGDFWLRARGYDEILPWDHLDARVTKGFLLADRRKIDRSKDVTTFDCRDDLCAGCSCCFEGDIRNRLAKYGDDPFGDGRRLPLHMTQRVAGGHDFGKKLEDAVRGKTAGVRDQAAKSGEDAAKAILRRRSRPKDPSERRWHTTPGAPGAAGPAKAFLPENIARETTPSQPFPSPRPSPERREGEKVQRERPHRYRIRYRRVGGLRFLSHLELLKLVYRVLSRAQLPLRFSEGFHPKPRIMFGPPLPVGTESDDEAFDIYLDEPREPATLLTTISAQCPEGVEPFECHAVPHEAPSLQAERVAGRFVSDLSPLGLLPGSIADAIARFVAKDALVYEQDRHGEARTIDLKALVSELGCEGQRLSFTLRTDVATAKPEEVVARLLELPLEQARRARTRLVRSVNKERVLV